MNEAPLQNLALSIIYLMEAQAAEVENNHLCALGEDFETFRIVCGGTPYPEVLSRERSPTDCMALPATRALGTPQIDQTVGW